VIPWLFPTSGTAPTVASVLIGVVAAAFVGAAIGRLAARSMVWSAVRQMLIVIVACTVTFGIGRLVGVSV
jgi:VIT1/CCC1 family predicted Fe2+/Mn2+ transporter